MKRGEVYYLRFDDSIGHEIAAGRPVVVISSDKMLAKPTVVSVVYLTTSPKQFGNVVELYTPRKKSWALCDQIQSVDVSRLTDIMCILKSSEMDEIDIALKKSLQLDAPDSDNDRLRGEVLSLRVELETYTKMYERVLDLLVKERIDANMKDRKPELIVARPEPPKIDIDTDLLAKKMSTPNNLMEEDLDYNPVKTKLKHEKLSPPKESDTIVDSLGRTRKVRGTASVKTMDGKANINKDDWETIVAKTGISYNTAKNIVNYRRKNGPYIDVTALLDVPRFGTGCWNKYIDMFEV